MMGLLAFAGVAIDGGRLLTLQREVQNASDFAALAGARAFCNDEAFLPFVYANAAQNGFDNNGATNTVTGSHPPISGIYMGNPDYVQVVITATIPSAFIHLVYPGPLQVTADAVAACQKHLFAQVNKALFGIGTCPGDDRGIDGSGSNNEIIGPTHTNDYFYVGGSNWHFHGPVGYSDRGYVNPGGNQLPPGSPAYAAPQANPLASLTTAMYGPGGARVQGKIVHNLSTGGKVDIGRLTSAGLYNTTTRQLATGVYYAGNQEIDLSDSDMHGTVTLVSENKIKLGGSRIQLEPYVDGMVMFSNHQPSEPCKDAVIDLGGSGNTAPVVTHSPEPYGTVTGYTESDNFFHGLVYAPRGQVMTSGSKSTIRGAVIGWGIKLNGSNELIIYDDSFFPPQPPQYMLIE
jgi:hypothetical protein